MTCNGDAYTVASLRAFYVSLCVQIKTKHRPKNKAIIAYIDEYGTKAFSAFKTMLSLCSVSFIVTNYFGMEDTRLQLKLTGNFESRKA